MNILIMTNMFPPIRTGSSHYAYDLAKILSKSGHNVTVVTNKFKNYKPEHENQYPFKVVRLPCIYIKLKGIFDWFTILSLNPVNYFTVARIIKDNEIKIVHQVNHYLDSAILTRIICKRLKLPYVCSVHTQLQFKSRFFSQMLKFVDRLICGNFILKHAAKIISLDTEIVRYLEDTNGNKWLKEKLKIIPHGIELNSERFPQKDNYDLSNVIVSIGHVINSRNRINLIKAMKLVLTEFPNVKLEIIGRIYINEPIKLVKKLGLNKNVLFTGELSYTDTVSRLIKSDIHAVWANSKYIGMGTAISESMLCGIPVINNSPENLLGEKKLKNMYNIVLINDQDIEDIVQKIILLLKNKSLREKIGQESRKFIYEHMGLNKTKDKLLDVYSSVIK